MHPNFTMRRTVLAAFAVLVPALHAQVPAVWETVGAPNVSDGAGICCQIAVSPSNVPVIAFQDQSLGGINASALRFEQGAWQYESAKGAASVGQAWYTRLAFSNTGELYMACRDYASSGRISIRHYVAATNTWSTIGPTGSSPFEAHYTDIAIAPDGTPVVIYTDRATTPEDKATCMSFHGGLWHVLGGFGFSASTAAYTNVAVDGAGTIYAAFSDVNAFDPASGAGRATVMKYDPASNAWSAVGAPGFSPHGALNLSLEIDKDGTPWVAYYVWRSQLVVMRFDGNTWVQVGGSAAGADRPEMQTEGWRQWLSLAFDSQNLPYVAYQRLDDSNRAAVRRFRAGVWEPVGNLGFSAGAADYMSMALGQDDVPYVVFRDAGNLQRVRVMRCAPSPQSYCSGVVNSRGCLPVIVGSGTPSASSPNPFWITGTNVISNRTGMLLFGTRPDRTPFNGGTLCLGLPFRRSRTSNSGGNLTGPDCSGVLQRDFNVILRNGHHADLVPGTTVFAQYFYRDQHNPLGPGLTDALRFTIE
jgi:hypothetical protein